MYKHEKKTFKKEKYYLYNTLYNTFLYLSFSSISLLYLIMIREVDTQNNVV